MPHTWFYLDGPLIGTCRRADVAVDEARQLGFLAEAGGSIIQRCTLKGVSDSRLLMIRSEVCLAADSQAHMADSISKRSPFRRRQDAPGVAQSGKASAIQECPCVVPNSDSSASERP